MLLNHMLLFKWELLVLMKRNYYLSFIEKYKETCGKYFLSFKSY